MKLRFRVALWEFIKAPKTQALAVPEPIFQHAFAANSLTVLRVKAEK